MNYVYFSASGTTEKVIAVMADSMDSSPVKYDLLRQPPEKPVIFAQDEPAVFAFPVFGGRLPVICPEMLQNFRGNNTAAIAIVVYGNRAYDDALAELEDILTANGFITIAAAAFVAQHSIFPAVAAGRPDDADRQKIISFAEACKEKLASGTGSVAVSVRGNRPYVEASPVSLHPSGDRKCNRCGTCVKICPVQAITADSPEKTDAKKCIACTACIAACPQHSRGFHVPVIYAAVAKSFAKSNAERKEPEIFL